jgi:FAD dependent oxidoreductase
MTDVRAKWPITRRIKCQASEWLAGWALLQGPRLRVLALAVLGAGFLFGAVGAVGAGEGIRADVCVYGGTDAGVIAAVQAARMGKTAVIAEFGDHLGGITSGGLGATDTGNKAAIGGLAREFYHRVALHYAQDKAWQFETKHHYFSGRSGRSTVAEFRAPYSTMWTFEPHVAEDIFFQMVNEARVPVYFEQHLVSVRKAAGRIREITMENGKVYRAAMFIDATYEGDLLAMAGVSYVVGREPNSEYGETLNGIRAKTPYHQFAVPVGPYVEPGNPASGLLPFVQSVHPGTPGSGDRSVQAYNFRLCFTRDAANRLPLRPPPGYKPAQYELLARYLQALVAAGKKPRLSQFWNPIWMPNEKTDINNNGPFSTDFIGENYEYPEADYATRRKLWQAHQNYTRGFVYFLATDPRVPASLRAEMRKWGPARDEFTDSGGWPSQLYVREARRMVSDYVITQHDCQGQVKAADSVGLASYGMDSHNCRRLVKDGRVENEGDVQVGGFPPWPISYRALVPKISECDNLLVPVCLSATHIAYGSIRMEPVFMILGQSAATAAAVAIDAGVPVQKVPYDELRARLIEGKQVLDWTPHNP